METYAGTSCPQKFALGDWSDYAWLPFRWRTRYAVWRLPGRYMNGMALVDVILGDSFVFDKLNLRSLVFLFTIIDAEGCLSVGC